MPISTKTTTPVKRACDSCCRRKVKCISVGLNPCNNCLSTGLTCTYYAVPRKKGPKGNWGKVLSELRKNQHCSQLPAGSSSEISYSKHAWPISFARTPGLLSQALVESCVEFFFVNLYPSQPILDRQRAQHTVMSIEHSNDAYCTVAALCAYVMIQSNITTPFSLLARTEMAQMSNTDLGHTLLDEAVRMRRDSDHPGNPTHMSVLTSWLFYGCYLGLGRDNTAWYFLREATTQAQLLGMHDEETYKTDPQDISRKRVLFWMLFVAERTHALHKHRPISLHATIRPPIWDGTTSDRPISLGLALLANLYKPFDDPFMGVWNKTRAHVDAEWIMQLQRKLSDTLPSHPECAEVQAVDLYISQQWLRMLVWQLSVRQGLVRSVATDSTMTFTYPIEISKDLLFMTQRFSRQAMEAHGVGLIEKLFDIACCVVDVVVCTPSSPDSLAFNPRDCITRFLAFFSDLRGAQRRYLPLFLSKVSDVLPSLPSPGSLSGTHLPSSAEVRQVDPEPFDQNR